MRGYIITSGFAWFHHFRVKKLWCRESERCGSKWEEGAKCLKVNARLNNISIVGRNHKNVDDADFLLFLLLEGWKDCLPEAFLKSVSFESLCLNWKEKRKCHAALSHVTSPKDKTLSFPFCRKNESHFHQQQTPTENTGRGDKIGFLSGESFIFYYLSDDRVGITCFGNTWGAEWHCWKHRLTKVTCRDCGRLLRCFCLFWHDECLVLSEIKKCVVVRCRVCPFQQAFPTFSLHCRPLTTLSWTSRLNQGFWVAQTFWYFAVSPLPPPKNLSRAPKLQKNPNGFTPIGYLQRQ